MNSVREDFLSEKKFLQDFFFFLLKPIIQPSHKTFMRTSKGVMLALPIVNFRSFNHILYFTFRCNFFNYGHILRAKGTNTRWIFVNNFYTFKIKLCFQILLVKCLLFFSKRTIHIVYFKVLKSFRMQHAKFVDIIYYLEGSYASYKYVQ